MRVVWAAFVVAVFVGHAGCAFDIAAQPSIENSQASPVNLPDVFDAIADRAAGNTNGGELDDDDSFDDDDDDNNDDDNDSFDDDDDDNNDDDNDSFDDDDDDDSFDDDDDNNNDDDGRDDDDNDDSTSTSCEANITRSCSPCAPYEMCVNTCREAFVENGPEYDACVAQCDAGSVDGECRDCLGRFYQCAMDANCVLDENGTLDMLCAVRAGCSAAFNACFCCERLPVQQTSCLAGERCVCYSQDTAWCEITNPRGRNGERGARCRNDSDCEDGLFCARGLRRSYCTTLCDTASNDGTLTCEAPGG